MVPSATRKCDTFLRRERFCTCHCYLSACHQEEQEQICQDKWDRLGLPKQQEIYSAHCCRVSWESMPYLQGTYYKVFGVSGADMAGASTADAPELQADCLFRQLSVRHAPVRQEGEIGIEVELVQVKGSGLSLIHISEPTRPY